MLHKMERLKQKNEANMAPEEYEKTLMSYSIDPCEVAIFGEQRLSNIDNFIRFNLKT